MLSGMEGVCDDSHWFSLYPQLNLKVSAVSSCLRTSVELPHHSELEVLAVVPRIVQAKHGGSGLGLQLEGG